MHMSEYQVIVGNIGCVVTTNDAKIANDTYTEYVNMSISKYGRSSNEPVELIKDGEPFKSYHPINNEAS